MNNTISYIVNHIKERHRNDPHLKFNESDMPEQLTERLEMTQRGLALWFWVYDHELNRLVIVSQDSGKEYNYHVTSFMFFYQAACVEHSYDAQNVEAETAMTVINRVLRH